MKLSASDLTEMYWGKGLSCVDIGKAVGRDPKTVHSWMRSYGIETRGRGQDARQHFKPGHKICVGREIGDATREKIRQARFADGSKGLFRENGDHVLKGRRGDQIHSWKGGITPERQAFIATDEWKRAVAVVMGRANRACERCGKDHDGSPRSFHVHHVAPFKDFPELRADPGNLKLLCAPCHRWVHSAKNINNEMMGVANESA
jgi:5-methylcytosine-specific restriction enzyme A